MEIIKKEKSYLKSYDPVVVWLDDLTEIIRTMQTTEPEITTDDYKFSSLDDLKEHFGGQEIHKLKISSTKPYSSVTFERFSVDLYVGSSPTSGQLYHELDDLLMMRVRKRHVAGSDVRSDKSNQQIRSLSSHGTVG
jgi:hypothetical protein